jgi:hypothetical protein
MQEFFCTIHCEIKAYSKQYFKRRWLAEVFLIKFSWINHMNIDEEFSFVSEISNSKRTIESIIKSELLENIETDTLIFNSILINLLIFNKRYNI